MFPFVLPYWKRLDADAGVQEYIIGKVVHRQLRGDEPARLPMQQHRNVGIAIATMGFTRSTAEKNGSNHVVAPRYGSHEGVCSRKRIGINVG